MATSQNTKDSLFDQNAPLSLRTLPAETRNRIIQEAIFEGKENIAIHISEAGKIVLPQIMVVSRQIYEEAHGYINAALGDPNTIFESIIKDDDSRSVFNALSRISQQTGIKYDDLVARCYVSFVEHPNSRVRLGNLIQRMVGVDDIA